MAFLNPHLLLSKTTPDKIPFQRLRFPAFMFSAFTRHLHSVSFVAFSKVSTLDSVFEVKVFSRVFILFVHVKETSIRKEKFVFSVKSVSVQTGPNLLVETSNGR